MKKILAVLIAALMICLSVVPAMAVFPVGDALYFVGQCIELYNTSAQIHDMSPGYNNYCRCYCNKPYYRCMYSPGSYHRKCYW